MLSNRLMHMQSKLIRLKQYNYSKYGCLIVDFYNVYCRLIDFHVKKSPFSQSSFEMCFKKIANLVNTKTKIIVSKVIFEVSTSRIQELTRKYPNVIYIIVNDEYTQRGFNRERDDFVCIMLYFFNARHNGGFFSDHGKPLIVSNDRMKNYSSMVQRIKLFSLTIIQNGQVSYADISPNDLGDVCEQLQSKYVEDIDKTEFYFHKKQRRIS